MTGHKSRWRRSAPSGDLDRLLEQALARVPVREQRHEVVEAAATSSRTASVSTMSSILSTGTCGNSRLSSPGMWSSFLRVASDTTVTPAMQPARAGRSISERLDAGSGISPTEPRVRGIYVSSFALPGG